MMLTSTARAARGTCWWIPSACRSPSMSCLPICMRPKVPVVSWQDWLHWSRALRKSGQMQPIVDRKELADRCKEQADWELEVVEREPGTRGFSVVPRRWVVERRFSWISRNRRMSKDYERKVQE